MSRGRLNISVDKKPCYRQPHYDYSYEARKVAKTSNFKVKRCPYCSLPDWPKYILKRDRP